MNHKRVYPLYKAEGLQMRPKRPRCHLMACRHMEWPVALDPNDSRSMDFMGAELFDGRRKRLLMIAGNFARESLAIEVDERIGGQRVAEIVMRLGEERGLPKTMRVDSGPEFTTKELNQWV